MIRGRRSLTSCVAGATTISAKSSTVNIPPQAFQVNAVESAIEKSKALGELPIEPIVIILGTRVAVRPRPKVLNAEWFEGVRWLDGKGGGRGSQGTEPT